MAVTTINAIMRMRRGFESDLDISKLQVGEWALSTDTKFVRICYAPNKVVQIASQETMDATLAEIQQVFEQTLEEVESDVATVEEYMGTTLIYKNAAAASASEASASATTAGQQATASTNSSKDSEAWAVGTRNGQEVPPTDPAYHNNSKYWAQQVAANTLAGLEDVTITGVSDGQTLKYDESSHEWVNADTPDATEKTAIADFTTVNGGLLSECKVSLSPNQDLHGYDHPWVGGAGKNKIPLYRTAGNYTFNDATITVNDDNTVIVNGTSTNTAFFGWKFSEFTLLAGSYKINGQNNVDSTNKKLTLQLYNEDALDQIINLDSNIDYQFTLERTTNLSVRIGFRVGMSVSNAKMYPMIRLATETDPTFEPYSNICPISGHTQVDVQNHQKNLLDIDNPTYPNTFIDSQGQLASSSYYNTWEFEGGHIYTLNLVKGSGFDTVRYALVVNGESTRYTDNNLPLTIDSTNADTLYISLIKANLGSDVQLELGSTATEYAPYNGYQVTVNLGGTYYSGTLDMVSGVFTPDTAGVDISTLDFSISTAENHIFRTDSLSGIIKPSDNGESMPHAICSAFSGIGWSPISASDNGRFAVSTGGGRVVFIDHRYSTISDFISGNSGTQLVYELANPTSIQLSPTMVKALVGENHLSAQLEGQEIDEVKYKELFTYDDVTKLVEQEVKKKVPDAPTTDGTYTLKATVSGGAANYSWVSES